MGLKLEPVILKINDDNPLFAVHIGDIVCGGNRWSGIKKNDIEKQYDNFYSAANNLRPMLYTVIGEMDFFNQSPEIYNNYTKRKEYYSFNYGDIHFIVLNTTDTSPGEIGKLQTDWLKKDLELYKNSGAVFIFAHHPPFYPKNEIADKSDVLKDNIALHNLFLKYPVKAVFSGHLPLYYKEQVDNITYIISGCGDYQKKYGYPKANQYYLIDYSSDSRRP
ncbi:MAG: metallophosphoesterase [Spirochaetes bacterium]|nr:metallophosphoesterase [Spirochaetota bacterium]